MRYSVLGPIDVERDGVPLVLGGPRQRRLLGALLIADGRVVTVDKLADAVWGDEHDVPDSAPKVLQSYVSRLRSALGPDASLHTSEGGYSLAVPSGALDSARFATIVDEARSLPPAAALARLDDALREWRGPAFGEFAGELWARPHAARLEELRLVAHELRAQALLDLGRHVDAVGELETLTRLHPLRERLVGQLLLALHRSGRQAEALRTFAAHRRFLAEETGLEPSRDLVDLERRIALNDPSLDFVTQGRTHRGYVLAEVIGEGAFGTVYRAVQPVVGREVAVKVVRSELADDPSFIRRFDAEARLVARLEHPNIVPLYDYWREPGGAYLVFRYLSGGTVADAPTPWALAEVTRLVDDIGAALAAAHARGVTHRDVKPGNLVRDADGRTYLTDFGIALDGPAAEGPIALRSAGSPMYASPEQIRDGIANAHADQYAFAVVVWELLAGRAPFVAETVTALLRDKLVRAVPALDSVRADLPRGLGRVLQRATSLQPGDRYPSMLDLLDAWHEALAEPLAAALITGPVDAGLGASTAPLAASVTRSRLGVTIVNPYKGLRAFDEADTGDFFGRHAALDALRDVVARRRFVAVVGPSGSGKSSLVRAGLVPRLRADGHLVAVAHPGAHPVDELTDALLQLAPDALGNIRDALLDPARLIALVDALAPEGGELVLVLDQFEELWTLTSDAERVALLRSLVGALADDHARLRVVATVRADFYDRPLGDDAIGPLVGDGTFALPPLTAAELTEVIEAPAAKAGVHLEPALTAALLRDIAGHPSTLPLLQFTLTELFERRDGGVLSLASYENLGELAGALSTRAEEVCAGVDAAASRRLFLRLVALGDGVSDTRRRARRRELATVPDDVIEAYGAARLLTFDVDPATREPTVEVAHEALLQHWPRLRAWLDDDRAGIRIHRHLADSATAWESRGGEAGDLYRGARLEEASAWAETHTDELTPTERSFVQTSRNREQRTRRVRRSLLVSLVALLAIALVTASIAMVQGRRAQTQRDAARALRRDADLRRLVAESAAAREGDLALALLLAHEAYDRSPRADTEGALLGALRAQPAVVGFLRGGSPAYRLAASPDGTRLYVGRRDGKLDVWNLTDRTLMVSGRDVGSTGFLDVEVSPDGALLAVGRGLPFDNAPGARDWTVGLYRTSDLSPVVERLSEPVDPATTRGVARTTFLDNDTLLVPSTEGRLVAYDLRANPPSARTVFQTTDRIETVAAYRALDRVVLTTVRRTRGFDIVQLRASTFEVITSFPDPAPTSIQIQEVWLGPDSTRILVCGIGGGAIVDAASGAMVGEPVNTSACGLDFLPDGSILESSGSVDVTRRDTRGEPLGAATPIPVGGEFRDALAVGDHVYLATLAGDGAIGIVDPRALVKGSADNEVLARSSGENGTVDVSPDGRTMAVLRSVDGGASVLDLPELTRRVGSFLPDGAVAWPFNAIAFSPTGDELYVGGLTGTLSVFDTADGGLRRALPARRAGEITSVTAEALGVYANDMVVPITLPDGRVGLSSWDRVTVIDGVTGATVFEVNLPDGDTREIHTPVVVGSTLLYSDGALQLQRVSWPTGAPLPPIGAPGESSLLAAVPGTSNVVVWSPIARSLRVVDAANGDVVGEPIALPTIEASALSVDPTGRRVAIEGLSDLRYHLVDLASGRLVGSVGQAPGANGGARFALGGKALVTPGTPAQVWDLDPASWRAKACGVAGRNLTRVEWARYLPADEPYRATCPGLPTPP